MTHGTVSLKSIVEHFESLPDPRHTRNRRHLLGDVKGSPLASSNPRWLRTFRSRRPVAHNAASWTIWSAKRGSGRLGGWPVQPQSKSQVPNRKCSGMRSHKPTKLPKTLSERSCRTPRSTLVASQGSTRVRFLVRGVSTVSSPFGRAR